MENKMDEASLVLSQPHPFGAFFLRVFPGWKIPNSQGHTAAMIHGRALNLIIMNAVWPESRAWEFFHAATLLGGGTTGGWWSFFFFFRGVKEEYTLNKNPKPPQQTSKHLGKRLLSEVFAQNQHRRYPIDISRTRFEPVSSVRTFFTKIRFSLAKNMPPRSGFCSQKERLGTS